MKMMNNHEHICVECARIMTDDCNFHDKGIWIDGMKAKVSRRLSDKAHKVTQCPEFIDDTECLHCAFKDRCLTVEIIGQECPRFVREVRREVE